MKKNLFVKSLFSFSTAISTLVVTTHMAQAAIKNPVLSPQLGDDTIHAQSGDLFLTYFIRLWNTLSVVGGLLVILYFVWGAIDWLTSAGDKGKLDAARNKMLHAFIGLLLIVTSYTLIGLISSILFGSDFDILNPKLVF